MKVHTHSRHWREELLPQLIGLPLLPCGAGPSGKAPINPSTGGADTGWTTKAFTPEEISAMSDCVTSVGMRFGPDAGGLTAFDLDGEAAIQLATDRGCDPYITNTWFIGRESDPSHFKLVFKVPQKQWAGLPGKKTVIRASDKSQIEVFWSTGQCIVAGLHKPSGTDYFWPEGSPESVKTIPPEWLELWLSGSVREKPSITVSNENGWQDAIPCPICSRPELDCRINTDKTAVLCHRGKTWNAGHYRRGETTAGLDGQTWAYTGEKTTVLGSAACFVLHRERPQQSQPKLLKQEKVPAGQALRVMAEQLGDIPYFDVRSRNIWLMGRELTPTQVDNLYMRLSADQYTWSKELARDAITELAEDNPIDPVATYLNNLNSNRLSDDDWNNLDRLLFDIEDEIARAFMKRYLVSAVNRVLHPGCQQRQLPVLLGPQNIGKSELGKRLFGNEFFGDGLTAKLDVDDVTALAKVWCMELGELNNYTRRTNDALKAFISRTTDVARRKYGRSTVQIPRRSVFWATSNKSPLTDNTGSTRFVLIPLSEQKLPLQRVADHRDAIWCRAYWEARNNFQSYSTEGEFHQIVLRNSDFNLEDPWSELLQGLVNQRASHIVIKLDEVYDFLDIPADRQNQASTARIVEIMANLGWNKRRRRPYSGAEPVRGFWNPDPAVPREGVNTPPTSSSTFSEVEKTEGTGGTE